MLLVLLSVVKHVGFLPADAFKKGVRTYRSNMPFIPMSLAKSFVD